MLTRDDLIAVYRILGFALAAMILIDGGTIAAQSAGLF